LSGNSGNDDLHIIEQIISKGDCSIFASALGGLVVGLSYYLTVIYTVETNMLALSPAQWPIILIGGIAGLLGSVIDSLLGATLQYSGKYFPFLKEIYLG
jgi:uncharacterized membrane protein